MKEPEQAPAEAEPVVEKSEDINADHLPVSKPLFECGDDASRSIAGNHYE
jgi:hypothetical protein